MTPQEARRVVDKITETCDLPEAFQGFFYGYLTGELSFSQGIRYLSAPDRLKVVGNFLSSYRSVSGEKRDWLSEAIRGTETQSSRGNLLAAYLNQFMLEDFIDGVLGIFQDTSGRDAAAAPLSFTAWNFASFFNYRVFRLETCSAKCPGGYPCCPF